MIKEVDSFLYDELLSNIEQVLFVRDALDKDLSVLYVNDAYENSWGLSKQSLYDNPYSFLEVVHPDDKQMVIEAYTNTIIGKTELSIDFRVIGSDSKVRWLYAKVIPIYNQQGNIYRLVGITDDITHRKEKQIRISKLNKVQDDIIKMLAHDLRSPIAGVKFLAELINKEECREVIDKHSAQIVESCDDSLKMMDDLLSHIQVDSEGLVLNRKDFIVENQIRIVCDSMLDKIELKELRLSLPKTQTIAHLDQLRFKQIMTNLISNAIKFSHRFGSIEISLVKNKKGLSITISDTGIGIPENLKPEVFDLFSGARREGTFGEKSTGLGLSITKRLVKLHNGCLLLKSQESIGTSMELILPS